MSIYGPRYRHKSVAQVVEEIAALRRFWPGPRPRVFFTDDNLHLRPRFLAELAGALKSQKINWMAQMDVAVGRHPELLRLMSESGCSQLLIGFESLEPGAAMGMISAFPSGNIEIACRPRLDGEAQGVGGGEGAKFPDLYLKIARRDGTITAACATEEGEWQKEFQIPILLAS